MIKFLQFPYSTLANHRHSDLLFPFLSFPFFSFPSESREAKVISFASLLKYKKESLFSFSFSF